MSEGPLQTKLPASCNQVDLNACLSTAECLGKQKRHFFGFVRSSFWHLIDKLAQGSSNDCRAHPRQQSASFIDQPRTVNAANHQVSLEHQQQFGVHGKECQSSANQRIAASESYATIQCDKRRMKKKETLCSALCHDYLGQLLPLLKVATLEPHSLA